MTTKNITKSFLQFLGNHFLYGFISVLIKTYRIKTINERNVFELLESKQNFILAFWHGTMLIPWYYHRNKRILGLISKSKDGEILARILKKWNYIVARGSSSKGGEIALGIMIDYAKHEGPVCITPDGPKGPPHQFKAGAVIAAKKSGMPLVLLGVGYKNKYSLKSWDKFEIPKPFSEVNLTYSDKIYIDKNATYEETSAVILKCGTLLNELQKTSERFN